MNSPTIGSDPSRYMPREKYGLAGLRAEAAYAGEEAKSGKAPRLSSGGGGSGGFLEGLLEEGAEGFLGEGAKALGSYFKNRSALPSFDTSGFDAPYTFDVGSFDSGLDFLDGGGPLPSFDTSGFDL